MKARQRQAGFSLLEAIVAMTIMATSGMALFSWFSQSYEGLIRLEEVQERHQLMDDLQAYFSTLNLQQEGTQRLQVNGFDVTVTSTLVEPVQQGRSTAGGVSNFNLGLYDLDVDVRRNNRLIGQYETRLVGYRQVRNTNVSPN
jgi:general secretion pathway protein I